MLSIVRRFIYVCACIYINILIFIVYDIYYKEIFKSYFENLKMFFIYTLY